MQTFDIILGVVIGLAVGGSLVIGICVIVAVYVVWRRSQRKVQDSSSKQAEEL